MDVQDDLAQQGVVPVQVGEIGRLAGAYDLILVQEDFEYDNDCFAAKGFVRVAGNPFSCLFNYTCGRSDFSWIKLADRPPSQAVFIGEDLPRWQAHLEAELATILVTTDEHGHS